MRHFGAILQYLDEALGRYEREQARLTEAAESRREAEEEERRIAYDRWRAQEVERVKQGMAPDELAALTGRVRERLAERLGSDRSIGFEGLIAREVNTLVVEANDLPSYEVWRAGVPVDPTHDRVEPVIDPGGSVDAQRSIRSRARPGSTEEV